MLNLDVDVLGLLLPNILTVLSQLCATLVLFLILKKFAWNMVKNILDKRAEYEQGLLTEAETLRKENAELKSQLEHKLEEADKQAEETVANAQKEGSRIKESLVEEAKERSKQIVEDAQNELQAQKDMMLDQMHIDLVNVTIDATEKLLNEKLDSVSDKEAVENFIKEVTRK